MIEFPDVEQLAVTYLTDRLITAGDAQLVATRVPRSRPQRFVRVYTNGGGEHNMIVSRNQLVVHCYDTDAPRCATTIQKIVAILKDAPGRMIDGYPYVAWCRRVGGPTQFDDPDLVDVARYQAVVEWLIRADRVTT